MQLSGILIDAAWVAAGASIGTPARFFISRAAARRSGGTFPWGTLTVNVSGCLLVGVAAALAQAHGLTAAAPTWLFAATGFLGSYTTVSSFALETRTLARDGEKGRAAGYVVLSLGLCLAAVAGGHAAALAVLAGPGR